LEKDSPDELLRQLVSTGVEKLLSRKHLKDEKHGLRWGQLIDRCHTSIRIIGWSCMNVLEGGTRDLFPRLVTSKRRLEFLVLDASAVEQANSMNFDPICNMNHIGIADDFRNGLDKIKQLGKSISPEYRQYIEVRQTNWMMAWSAMAVDVDDADGLIQLEVYLYGRNLDDRPELILRQKPDGYYDRVKHSIDIMWKSAEKVEIKWED